MKITCVNDRGTKQIDLKDILYFEAFKDDCFCFTMDEKLKVKGKKLYDMEYKEYGFVRIHKSFIVNVFKIITLTPQVNSKIKIRVKNRDVLYINRTYIKSFKLYLKKGDYKK